MGDEEKLTGDAASVPSGRMVWIDVLKGIAMLGVIVIHTFSPSFGQLPPLLARVMSNSARGAQVFIVASAFLAFASAERLAARGPRWEAGYVIKRFLRLSPLYYLAIAAYLLANGTGRNFWTGGRPITAVNVVAHLTYVNVWWPVWINSILHVEWTIGVLAVFFVLVPAVVRWVRSLRAAVAWFAAGLAVAVALNWWLLAIPAPVMPAYLWREFLGIWFFAQAPVLLAGVVAYFADRALVAHPDQARAARWRQLSLVAGLAVIAAGLVSFGGRAALAPSVVFGAGGAAVLLGVARLRGDAPWLRPLAFLGTVSLGVYLFHLLVVQDVVAWLSALTGMPQYLFVLRLLAFPIVIALSAGAGWLGTRFVEKPVAAWSERLFAKRAAG